MDIPKGKKAINWNETKSKMEETTVPGSSLAGTQLSSLMNKGYVIVCGIVVQNWTNMEMSSPETTINTGSMSTPPTGVAPGHREAVIAHKYGFSMKGTSGLISWLLSDINRRVVVMWNVPCFRSDNILAVGLTKPGTTMHHEKWFTSIDNASDRPDLHIKRGKYYNTCNEIMIEDDSIQVLGTMGTGSRPEVRITVRPKYECNLAIKSGK